MKTRSKVVLGILAVILILVVASILVVRNTLENGLEELSATPIADIDFSEIPDGRYEGEYGAIPVAAAVAVTVQDGRVQSIDLVRHDNGQGQAAEVIIDHVGSSTIRRSPLFARRFKSWIRLPFVDRLSLRGDLNRGFVYHS